MTDNDRLSKELSVFQEQFEAEKLALIEFTMDKVQEENEKKLHDLVQFTMDKVQEENEKKLHDLVQFTMDKVQEEHDEVLNNLFVKIAEEFVAENEQQLEIVSEDTAVKLISGTIAESLELAGVTLDTDESDVIYRMSELEEELNDYKRKTALYEEAINDIQKEILIQESTVDMSDLQKDRFERLARNVPYHDRESFEIGLKYIQESVLGQTNVVAKQPKKRNDDFSFIQEDEQFSPKSQSVNDLVSATLSAMRR
jgi:hypothetical protein